MGDLRTRLLRRVARLNREWNLIEDGDRVMVACSGGKDSWALLHLLRDYQRVAPFSFSLVAMHLDQGHPPPPGDLPVDRLRAHFETEGFEYRIDHQDTHSVVKASTPAGKIYCSLCSRMRRGALHRVAAELAANKIALGHHRDDVVETALLSMMFAGEVRAIPPLLTAQDNGCAVIRPLVSSSEAELAQLAEDLRVPIVPCNLCGSQPDSRRAAVKRLLIELEHDHPNLRETLFASLAHVRPDSLYDKTLRTNAESPPRTKLSIASS